MNKDNRLSLSSFEEVGVTVCFILKESKEIIFELILMMGGWDNLLLENSKGGKSGIHYRE